ncbi:MAG: response regulator transcription factor [Flavisolibacter sp.]
MQILLVEDEQRVADFIKQGLNELDYRVDLAYDGLQGQKMALEKDYDLVILDVLIPHINGIDLCKRIRDLKSNLPILMLTALGTTNNKVEGFESGADDYMLKPFHFAELVARINALTRRSKQQNYGPIITILDLEMDSQKRIARRAGKVINLTTKEFSLLELLINNRNKVLSRTFIAETVWGLNHDRGTNFIDVYINYLRTKIDKGFNQTLIHTVIGKGYTIKVDNN